MTKWEYKCVYTKGPSATQFNALGAEGWELCGLHSEERPNTSPRWEHSAVFKRPLPATESND